MCLEKKKVIFIELQKLPYVIIASFLLPDRKIFIFLDDSPYNQGDKEQRAYSWGTWTVPQDSSEYRWCHCSPLSLWWKQIDKYQEKKGKDNPLRGIWNVECQIMVATWNSWQTFGGELFTFDSTEIVMRGCSNGFFSNLCLASHTSTVFLTMWTDRGQGKIFRRDVISLLTLQLWNQCKACKWYII